MNDALTFKGWWAESEKTQTEAWETFKVCLHGEEAGDFAFQGEGLEEALAASGYRIVLKKIDVEKPEPWTMQDPHEGDHEV